MARSDRLFRLLQAMRVMPAPITATRLAAETGVSLRSLYRDIDSLRAAGARIEGERGYGYRLTEDDALPPQTFDRAELEAIALGMGEVRHMGDPVLARAATSVLAKIAARLPGGREQQLFHAISHVWRPETRYRDMTHVEAVRRVCWEERALTIGYADKGGETTERTIFPLTIVYTSGAMTVLAWCCLREAFRMFRLDRMSDARDAGRSFRPRRVPLLRDYVALLRAEDEAERPA